MVNANLGQKVKISGAIERSFWSKIGLEDPVLKVHEIELVKDVYLANTIMKK